MRKTCLVALAVCAVFLAGAYQSPQNEDEITVKRSPSPGWVDVYRGGVLDSEWQAADGEVYRVLVELLETEPRIEAPVRPKAQLARSW